MKHATLAVTLSVAIAAPATASAQGVGSAAKAALVETEMKAMDQNGDGRISADEHAARAGRIFETMDADRDGKVTAAEMEAAHERVTGGRPLKGEMSAAERIKVIDTNGDGVLAAEEHRAGSKAMFERMDADKDGALVRAELAAGHAMKTRK